MAVGLGAVGLVAMRGGAGRGGAASPEVQVSAPAAPKTDVGEENRRKYVESRHREIAAETFRGLAYSQLEPEWVVQCKDQAGKEYQGLCLLLGEAERLGAEKGRIPAYRAAADLVWPMVRDLSRYGQTPEVPWIRAQLERAVETVRNP